MIELKIEPLSVKRSEVLKYWRDTVVPCGQMPTEALLESILYYALDREMEEEGFKKWLAVGGQYR